MFKCISNSCCTLGEPSLLPLQGEAWLCAEYHMSLCVHAPRKGAGNSEAIPVRRKSFLPGQIFQHRLQHHPVRATWDQLAGGQQTRTAANGSRLYTPEEVAETWHTIQVCIGCQDVGERGWWFRSGNSHFHNAESNSTSSGTTIGGGNESVDDILQYDWTNVL